MRAATTVRVALLLVLVVGALYGWRAPAQDRGAGPGAAEPAAVSLARFGDARALALDPRGRLYVADAARDVVQVFGPAGRPRTVLGGAGTQAGAFDTPSDIDPTNGQVLLVADTYNGRIQHVSEDGQYLESLPVGRPDRGSGAGWRGQTGTEDRTGRGDGRPVAVGRHEDGTIVVLDRRTRRLLTWTDLGSGGQLTEAPSTRLDDPVALAVGDGGRVYVADAGRGAVWLYDTFGTFVRRLSLPPLPTVRALSLHRGRLWIVCRDRVLVWTRAAGLVAEHPVDVSEPLVDAVPTGRHTYLLTPTRLLRRPGW